MPYQTARIPIKLRDTTVYETVAVAPADQLKSKVLLSTPVNSTIVEHLVDSYLAKQDGKQQNTLEPLPSDRTIQVNQVTRPQCAVKIPVKYFSDKEDTFYEDDRASDTSYEPGSDTDTASEFSDSEDDVNGQESAAQPREPQTLEPSPQSIQPEPTHPDSEPSPLSAEIESTFQSTQSETPTPVLQSSETLTSLVHD